jgi:hypothetical protein
MVQLGPADVIARTKRPPHRWAGLVVVDDRGPLVIGEWERVARERLHKERCASEPRIVAQLLTRDGVLQEQFRQAQRHAHRYGVSVFLTGPVGVGVAADNILHLPRDGSEPDHSPVLSRKP